VEKTSTGRRSRIPCVVVEKITTRRREGVGVVVEKKKKVDELSTKIRVIYLQQQRTQKFWLPYTKQINNLTRKQNYESKTVDVSMM